MERASASDRTREELRALMDGRLDTAASRSDLVRLAVRLIIEEALDAEVTDALGRERYERAAPRVSFEADRSYRLHSWASSIRFWRSPWNSGFVRAASKIWL